MASITSILTSYNNKHVNKFNDMLTREEHKLAIAFVHCSKDVFECVSSNIKEDETLTEYRKEYQSAIIELGLKGSNYTFANAMKIGKLYKEKQAWLLGFKNLTSLAIALAGIVMVPACKGIASLEVMPAGKASLDDTILSLPSNLNSAELREKVNIIKGIPSKEEKIKEVEEKEEKEVNSITGAIVSAKEVLSAPTETVIEKTALAMAKTISAMRDNEAFLIAFSSQCANLGVITILLDKLNKANKISMADWK